MTDDANIIANHLFPPLFLLSPASSAGILPVVVCASIQLCCMVIPAMGMGALSRWVGRTLTVQPVSAGVPWLGFVVWPDHRRVKGRKVVEATRRLTERFDDWQSGRISFGEFDATVQGWINHVRYADTWGLWREVFACARYQCPEAQRSVFSASVFSGWGTNTPPESRYRSTG